ncbi:predicted protein [Coccidioides posadasii str. Silveira]|uniref:Predicted protein n=2 Tax=Coccidioides posadasii (strain RMSCC 757 / Silveira) TaxID=443226 RepID=E9DCJ2_COCPS|nr:predicted protein [Coccidioides posadasii str. Silveira]
MFILYLLFPSWEAEIQVLSAEFTDCGAELNAGGQTKRRMRARQILTGRHDIDAMDRDVGNRLNSLRNGEQKRRPVLSNRHRYEYEGGRPTRTIYLLDIALSLS